MATRAAVEQSCAAAERGQIVTGRLPLAGLAEAARCCRACPLYKDATQTVFGEGRAHAGLMLVGEQPGDEEDRKGRPFVGPAGRLLDDLLEEAGVDRASVYVTNAVKHFKFVMKGKRRLHQKPKSSEVKACQPWLDAELDRVHPTVLLALGATAGLALYGSKVSVLRDRGRPLPSGRAPICLISFHPSAALRGPSPEDRARVRKALVADLALAARHLAQSSQASQSSSAR